MTKILVIDDTKAITDIIDNILSKEGYTVTKAYNGQQAIDVMEKGADFDLVITDMLMPEKDGFDVISFVKNHSSNTKIIAMTGGGVSLSPGEVMRAVGDKISGFLIKPIGKTELFAAIDKALL